MQQYCGGLSGFWDVCAGVHVRKLATTIGEYQPSLKRYVGSEACRRSSVTLALGLV